MNKPEQLPFELSPKHAYAREDFWISSSNRDAVSWLDKSKDWTNSTLIINGPASCGKTHLLKIWTNEKKAYEITEQEIIVAPEYIANHSEILNVSFDAVDTIIGNIDKERALFHIYNTIKERKGSLLLTSSKNLKECQFIVPDLKTRLLSSAVVSISSPDEELIAILLSKLFSDKQISVSQEVVGYIVPRVERSFPAIKALADAIDQKALSEKKPVTIPMVKAVMEKQASLF